MRNVLIHDYVGVDEAVIWRTIQDDLPSLCESVRGILAEFVESGDWTNL